MENKRVLKRIFVGFAVLLAVSSLFYYHKAILIRAGNYLAPEGTNSADVLIVEGGMLIKTAAVKIAIDLISSRKADYLIVVDLDVEGEDIFALSDYPQLVARNLEALGLRKEQKCLATN
jgi:hypothetical protein